MEHLCGLKGKKDKVHIRRKIKDSERTAWTIQDEIRKAKASWR